MRRRVRDSWDKLRLLYFYRNWVDVNRSGWDVIGSINLSQRFTPRAIIINEKNLMDLIPDTSVMELSASNNIVLFHSKTSAQFTQVVGATN